MSTPCPCNGDDEARRLQAWRLHPGTAPGVPGRVTSRRLTATAFFGALVWVLLLFVDLGVAPGAEALGARLLLLAPLILVPLLLDAAAPPDDASPWLRAASWTLGPGALIVVASLLVPVGRAAGGLAAVWLLPTGLVAAWGVTRGAWLWRDDRLDAPEAILAVGCLGLPGGAVWLVMSRAGIDPGPYGSLVVLLTAVHFHFATFVAPVWAALLGRAVRALRPAWSRAFAGLGAGLVGGTPLVAVGIALSGTPAGHAPVETLGVVVLTASAIGLAGLGLAVAPRLADRGAALMVGVSAAALLGAMALSLWFNVGARLGVTAPDLLWMLPRHGWLNGVGFGLWGALGWQRAGRTEARLAGSA